MAWDSLGTYKEEPQSAQEQHILNVYSDPDFINDIELVFPKNDRFPDYKSYLMALKVANREQYEVLLNFLVTLLPKEQVVEIAQNYFIRPEDVLFFMQGHTVGDRVYRESNPFTINEDAYGGLVAKVDSDITKEDFLQIWKIISRWKDKKYDGKIPKNKLPAYDKLLYAIFKARKKGHSFGSIFEEYSKGKLPYYQNGAKAIGSEEKLKDYYYKYGPKSE